MSKQNSEGPKTCLQCGHQVSMGSYCDKVSVRSSSGKLTVRFLHGGPCGMKFIQETGVDFTRMVHPVVDQKLLTR